MRVPVRARARSDPLFPAGYSSCCYSQRSGVVNLNRGGRSGMSTVQADKTEIGRGTHEKQFYYYITKIIVYRTHKMNFFVRYKFLDLPTQVYSSIYEISSIRILIIHLQIYFDLIILFLCFSV